MGSEDPLSHYIDATTRMRQRAEEAESERDRLKAFVELACSDLDDLAEHTGNGDIGVVVERLIDELGLSYPFSEPREPHDGGALDRWTADRLRDEVRRLRDVVWGETKLRASLAGARYARDEAIAERDRLKDELEAVRPQYEGHVRTLNAGIHGLDRVVTAAAELVDARIESEADREEEAWVALGQALGQLDGEVPPAQRILVDYARDLEIERNRLRVVVDAVREYRSVMKTRTDNLNGGSPDLQAEAELSDRARALNQAIDIGLAALDGGEATDG